MSPQQTIIVIGAARSGTKILRDTLGRVVAGGIVPYDAGFVWRHGNESVPHDELRPDQVTPRTRRLVTRYLDSYRRSGIVIEKTVGNALRVPFVQAVVPDARFVHLVRDGVDVVASAQREWRAPTDWSYLRGKARHFPLRLVPTYGVKFVANATWRRRGTDGYLPTWGPRYRGIDDDLRREGLLVVCARQWRESVTRAGEALRHPDHLVVHVRFEELLASPESVLTRIADELALPADPRRVRDVAAMIRPGSVHHGRAALPADHVEVLESEIGHELEELGYARVRG